MGRLHTTARTADASSDVSETVPGWRALLERVQKKDERIDELESEVERLRAELEQLRADARDDESTPAETGSSKAAELVDALKQTADSDAT